MVGALAKTISGGGWSEVGKQVEKPLLTKIFTDLGIPISGDFRYDLINDEEDRDIDAQIYKEDKVVCKIELKLLGNGNVEIADEAIASPLVSRPDSLIAMNEASLNKFGPRIKSGGLLIMNSSPAVI